MTLGEAIKALVELLIKHGDIDIRIQVATYKPGEPDDFELIL